MIAYAQSGTELAHSFVATLNSVILFPLIALLTVIAMLYFLWGGFQYVSNAASDPAREQGRKHILYGIIGLLVMLSAYAILTIAANTIGVDVDQYSREADFTNTNSGTTQLPQTMPTAVPPGSPTTNTGGNTQFGTVGDGQVGTPPVDRGR